MSLPQIWTKLLKNHDLIQSFNLWHKRKVLEMKNKSNEILSKYAGLAEFKVFLINRIKMKVNRPPLPRTPLNGTVSLHAGLANMLTFGVINFWLNLPYLVQSRVPNPCCSWRRTVPMRKSGKEPNLEWGKHDFNMIKLNSGLRLCPHAFSHPDKTSTKQLANLKRSLFSNKFQRLVSSRGLCYSNFF